MEVIRWIGAVLLAAFFVGFAVFNWRVFATRTLKGDDTMGSVPVVGGLLGALATVVCPAAGVAAWWWVPLVLDFGSVPYGLWLAYRAVANPPG